MERVVIDLGKLLYAGGLDGGAIKTLGQKLRGKTVAVASDEKTATAGALESFAKHSQALL